MSAKDQVLNPLYLLVALVHVYCRIGGSLTTAMGVMGARIPVCNAAAATKSSRRGNLPNPSLCTFLAPSATDQYSRAITAPLRAMAIRTWAPERNLLPPSLRLPAATTS